MTNLQQYEAAKRNIQSKQLSSEQYLIEIQKLAKKYKV